jgi:hypothetical protein
MTAVAWAALATLLGWLVGLQMVRVGQDSTEPSSRRVRITTAVLGAAAALLVTRQLDDGEPHAGQEPDLTALVLVVLTAWLIGLQTQRVGRDRSARRSDTVRVTTALLGGAAALLAMPRLYFMVT